MHHSFIHSFIPSQFTEPWLCTGIVLGIGEHMENIVVVTAHKPSGGAGMRFQGSAVCVLMGWLGEAMGAPNANPECHGWFPGGSDIWDSDRLLVSVRPGRKWSPLREYCKYQRETKGRSGTHKRISRAGVWSSGDEAELTCRGFLCGYMPVQRDFVVSNSNGPPLGPHLLLPPC